ncbi:MAG: hypothetical protein KGL59_04965 [Acidobacteriota bacterium]|nr:hypothetical protein [Acidobacteriota bacterium]
MTDLKKQEQAAIEAVARRFSATWEKGSDLCSAWLTVAGKRVAVDIGTLKQRNSGKTNAAKPGLRFDKVVTRLMEHLQSALAGIVPDRTTVLLTITAPIRLPSKTAVALETKIQTLLGKGSRPRDVKATIHGKRIQVRLLRNQFVRAPKLIGFVHNPDSDPLVLLNLTSDLLERISPKPGRQARRPAGDRWLVLINAGGISFLEAYRYICSQLRTAPDFQKVLMVFDDGRVEVLAE